MLWDSIPRLLAADISTVTKIEVPGKKTRCQHRYPSGESYMDLIQRLEPLIIGHRSRIDADLEGQGVPAQVPQR